MKLKLTFKTNDVVDRVIEDEIAAEIERRREFNTEDEMRVIEEEIRGDLTREITAATKPWVKYGEYCNVEIDTMTGRATVLEV